MNRKLPLFVIAILAAAGPMVLVSCRGRPKETAPERIAVMAQRIETIDREAYRSKPDVYDPVELARLTMGEPIAGRFKLYNGDAAVPSQCYTATGGIANPCWTCHTQSVWPNERHDWELQQEYAFSQAALTNNWTNLHEDRSKAIAAISDEEALRYVRNDNYTPLRPALEKDTNYLKAGGYLPDLDFSMGFDDEGFARDGSGWRALRYKPFLGTFWPTNGSTDDVFIRLPEKFRRTADGAESREIYKLNLSILEAAIAFDPRFAAEYPDKPEGRPVRRVEPVLEDLAGTDLDGDGKTGGTVTSIKGLPARYAGGASDVKVFRHLYPEGSEYLHSVRYIDPDAPGMISVRMKELRYSKKKEFRQLEAVKRAYEHALVEKNEFRVPVKTGSPLAGYPNEFGWSLQAFIEDEYGRLRLQTAEEHHFCLGCHSGIGVTVDQTFTLARKVPGEGGWKYQNIGGIPDVPQAGHKEPEILTYFDRVTGGDEFRANTEMLDKFFPGGKLDKAKVKKAAPGGTEDITYLVAPSRERALLLNKAYMALVKDNDFHRGRDTVISPPVNVHRQIVNGNTELAETGRVFTDGRLWLDWTGVK